MKPTTRSILASSKRMKAMRKSLKYPPPSSAVAKTLRRMGKAQAKAMYYK